MMIDARLADAKSVRLLVCFEATVGEWELLKDFIERHAREPRDPLSLIGDGAQSVAQAEPFWSIIHRLGDVLNQVMKHHTDYGR